MPKMDGAEAAALDRRKKRDAVEEKGESEKIPFRKDGKIETHRGGEPGGIKEKGDPAPLMADRRADSDAIRNDQRDSKRC